MPLIDLKIPPGVVRHGTELDSFGRWRDANLVRWEDGSLRPIGGWTPRVTSGIAAPPRGAHAWLTNTGDRFMSLGTYEKLYVIEDGDTVVDITPAGLATGSVDASANYGYGGGSYGVEAYGIRRLVSSGTLQPPTSWTLDNWGQNLVACSDTDGGVYEWVYTSGGPALAIPNAPTGCSAIIVTAERFLFALGAGGNPRLVRWSDRENNNLWAPEATNEAGDIELQTPGRLMAGIKVRGRTLLLTTTDAHAASYSGPPTVYGFERVGTGCGVVSRNAAVAVAAGALWMGEQNFYIYDGSVVSELPCTVLDHVFQDIARSQIGKVAALHNQAFGEVWWFYPSGGSTENDRYVAFNYKEQHWTIGTLDRTAGIPAGVFNNPIIVASDGVVYDHEVTATLPDNAAFAETGPLYAGAGDQVMCATELISDELVQGDVLVTFKTRFHPNDVEREYGPYDPANPTSVRFTGRQVRMRVTGRQTAAWRVGTMRLDVTPGGRR